VTLPPQGVEIDFSEFHGDIEPPAEAPGNSTLDELANSNDVEAPEQGQIYVWYEGDEERRVRLAPNLTSEQNGDEPLGIGDSTGSAATGGAQGQVAPVFVDDSTGEVMELPGGVLIAFVAEWDEAQINSFFAQQGIDINAITPSALPNTFLIDTAAGFPSLLLAQKLAQLEGVDIAVPNWAIELELQ